MSVDTITLTPEQLLEKVKEMQETQQKRVDALLKDVLEVWKKHNPLKEESLFVLISLTSMELFNAEKVVEKTFIDRLKIAVKKRRGFAHRQRMQQEAEVTE